MINKVTQTVPDSFGAFLVSGANFTKSEEYPILENSMISKTIPYDILPFNKAITSQKDLKNTFICFFEPDATFERVRRNPKRYLSFFKRTAGIIGFDFSVHSDMPLVKQKAQMNDNLSLTYFYGSNGVPVIPNIRCGIDELIPEFLTAIPKHELIAVGTHGFIKTMPEKHEWFCFLENVINTLDPSKVIVYGTLSSDMFNVLKDKKEFILYDSWIARNSKERKLNGK